MHAISATVLLASFVTGICAGAINPKVTRQALGTFDTFTDIGCSEGGEGITVADNNASGTLSSDVNSIKAYIPDCALVIWVNGGGWYPLVIRPGDSTCIELTGPGRDWNVSC